MNEPQIATGFDEAERGRIRAALRRYMAENGIGTPTLQYRIIEADKPRHREIPLATLQRFITGAHRTQDHHVAVCHAFVRELPWYGEGRDIAQFGSALFTFLQGHAEAGDREELTARLTAEFAGSYESASSRLTLTAVERQPYLHAHELGTCLLASDQESGRGSDELAARRRSREGVMVLSASGIYVVLRDGLTRQLRIIHLMKRAASPDEEGVLAGEAYQPAFIDGMRAIQERVRFVAAAAREHA